MDRAKQAIRERVWSLLEREQAAPPGVHGRIPSFFGADYAADQLATLPAWHATRVIKAVPDTAQQPVRVQALREGKLVYMAVPKLADKLPFYILDPPSLPVLYRPRTQPRRTWQRGLRPKLVSSRCSPST